MRNDIEFEDLEKIYSDETIQDMVEHWQNDIFTHALTCEVHKNVVLKYQKGILYCPEDDCFYHVHWIPMEVVNHWNEIGE